jgi:plasmid stability protein
MVTTIQIRRVPAPVHRRLKARAAAEGLSISEFMLREVERIVRRPTPQEMRARLARLRRIDPPEPAAAMIRRDRDVR